MVVGFYPSFSAAVSHQEALTLSLALYAKEVLLGLHQPLDITRFSSSGCPSDRKVPTTVVLLPTTLSSKHANLYISQQSTVYDHKVVNTVSSISERTISLRTALC